MNPTSPSPVAPTSPTMGASPNPQSAVQNIIANYKASNPTAVHPTAQANDWYSQMKANSQQTQSQPSQDSQPSQFSSDINKAGSDVSSAIKGEGEYAGQNPVQRGIEAAGNAARGISTTAMNAAANVIPGGKEALGFAGKLYGNAVNAAGKITSDIGDKLSDMPLVKDFVAKHPELTDNIMAVIENGAKMGVSLGDISNLILGAKGVSNGIQAGVDTVKDVSRGVRTINDVAGAQPMMEAQKHLDMARQVLDNEPNVSEADAINHAHTNIVDGMNGANMKEGAQAVSQLNPTDYKTLEDYSNAVDDAIGKGPKAEAPALNEKAVLDSYNRAIRPTVSGKGNATQLANANSRVIDGLQTIADNKEGLSFTDADGETVTGSTPRSVDQLSQAIQQTKQSIFKKYDALANEAGGKGITVDPQAVTGELDSVVNNKAVQLANPEAVKYAQSVQDRFNNVGEMTPSELQDTIEVFNNKLKGYYRNPTPAGFSDAAVDSMMVNKLRTMLDDAISSNTEGAYSELKSQYGALSSMEKDVAHRSVVWARQNNVGIAGNIANITSGAELARGLITMNPADIAVSVGIKGLQKYMEYLNNPDVGVQRIFSAIEKSNPSATGSTIPPSGANIEESSSPTTIPPDSPKVKGGVPDTQKIVGELMKHSDNSPGDVLPQSTYEEYVKYPLKTIRVNDVEGLDEQGLMMGAETKGKQVTTPILVDENPDGTFQLVDGNHRTTQALVNGDINIQAFVKPRITEPMGPFEGKTNVQEQTLIPKQQPVKTVEELHKIAVPAKVELDTVAQKVADQHGAKVMTAPLKSQARIQEKANSDYGGNINHVKDIARNTIVTPHDKIAAVVESLKAEEGHNYHREQTPEDYNGYSGHIINHKASNGHVGEIQVNTPEMIYAKEPPATAKKLLGQDKFDELLKSGIKPGLGHKYYEIIRSPESTPAQVTEATKSSHKYYTSIRELQK